MDASGSLGYQNLQEQQKDAIVNILEGIAVFVVHLTGYAIMGVE